MLGASVEHEDQLVSCILLFDGAFIGWREGLTAHFSTGTRKAMPTDATKIAPQRRCFFQKARASGGHAAGWKTGSSEPM
jgi:hypothetical protein